MGSTPQFPRTYKSTHGAGWTGIQLALPLATFHQRDATGAPEMMRSMLAHIAHGLDLPSGRTWIRVEARRHACFGYVRIYMGEGTTRERASFGLAIALAEELQTRLCAQHPELLVPEFHF